MLSKKGNVQKKHSDFIWPIGHNVIPDEMNTSFGPLIKHERWQFHNGIDLPKLTGTPAYAMHYGEIYHAGPANPPLWNSNQCCYQAITK